MGGIRIRQYRVNKKKCSFNGHDYHCETYTEDKNPMQLNTLNKTIKWSTKNQNKEQIFNIRAIHAIYPGSGFVIFLPLNKTVSLDILHKLRQDRFIDSETRMISVDFNLFNPTYITHTICRLVYELGISGDVNASYRISTWRLLAHYGTQGLCYLAFQILFLICVFVKTFNALKNMYTFCKQNEGNYFIVFKNYICKDLHMIFLCFYWLFIGLSIEQFLEEKQTELLNVDSFISLQHLESLTIGKNYVGAWCGLLLFMNFFEFFYFSRRLSFLWRMLSHSCSDIIAFAFVIMVIVIGFGFCGFLLFSPDLFSFRSFGHAIFNLFTHLAMEMDFQEIKEQHPFMGSAYVSIWNLFIVIILANVFIAILSESFLVIRTQKAESENIIGDVMEGVKQKINNVVGGKSSSLHDEASYSETDSYSISDEV
eukprot:503796_1